MASIPLGLLRSVHRHQNAAREVGAVLLAPARPHVIRVAMGHAMHHAPCARGPRGVPPPRTQPLPVSACICLYLPRSRTQSLPPPPRQVLALGSLFAAVAWRGPPAWFAGALALAHVLLALLALLALAACRRARALDTAPNTVQGDHAQAAEVCAVPVAFSPDDAARVRPCACWRGCALYAPAG